MRKALFCSAGAVLVLLLSAGVVAAARHAQEHVTGNGARDGAKQLMASTSPNELVRQVTEKELQARDEGEFMYRDWRQTPEGSKTKEMIDTRDGVVARLIAINDKPLTPEQRAAEQARLQNLLAHPELQKQRQKEQQQDEARVTRMFRELPKAFIYEYEGIEPGNSCELIKLKFTPNPNYAPPSRETSVFRAMAGMMWVSVPDLRLARIEATLFRDVNFGWGILGHLDKGGHFFIEQSKIASERWVATYLNIQFTGKALLFKSINLRQIEKLSEFRPVPSGLTLAQGIDMLLKHEAQVAENAGAPTK